MSKLTPNGTEKPAKVHRQHAISAKRFTGVFYIIFKPIVSRSIEKQKTGSLLKPPENLFSNLY